MRPHRAVRAATTLFLPLLLVLLGATSAAAQEAATGLEARVDSLMADYDREGSPGAVVGLIRDGRVAFAKGYGEADLAHGIPITPETRFNIGSVSKQFLGLAFAMLDARGVLSLDDPVAAHLEDWPTFADTVRIRHLLTHTSGYREAYGTLALAGRGAGEHYLPRSEALEVVRRQPTLEFPAGSEYQYNSTAYVVLAEIAERVTGQPAAGWVAEHLLGPLGMEETVIETEVGQVIPGGADSYSGSAEDGFRREVSNRAIFGAAEVFTTVRDVARWFRNLGTGEVGGSDALAALTEPYVLTTGDTLDYALGIRVDEHRGLRRLQHGGAHAGYRAHFSYYPGLDAGVVVMSNYDRIDAGRVADTVAGFAFDDRMDPPPELPAAGLDPIELDSTRMAGYAGHYRTESGNVVPFTLRGDTLVAAGQIRLLPVADTLFRTPDGALQVGFHRRAGAVTGATARQLGDDSTTLERVELWKPSAEELRAFTGVYASPELETAYTLVRSDSGLVMRHRWRGERPLEPLVADEFRTDDGVRLTFERNATGQVTGFYATIGRTRDVWFQRRE